MIIPKKYKILLIEDDDVDVMAFERAMKKAGIPYSLDVCHYADHAFRTLTDLGKSYDCIFLDYQLPGADGLTLLKKINTLDLNVPIAVMTSQGDEKIAVEMMKEGAFDYFPKSDVTPDKISRTIYSMIHLLDASREKEIAKKALLEKEHFIQKITNASPNIIHVFDIQTKRNVYFNDEIVNILGYTKEEVLSLDNQFYAKKIHRGDLAKVFKYHLNMRNAEDGEIRTIEYRIKKKSGVYIWLLSRDTVFLRNESGDVKQVLGTAIDITERIKTEEELVKAKQQAEQAAKTKAEFLSNMSHEIRTPMNAIIGLTQILLRNDFKGQDKVNLRSIKHSADNLLVLINDILDFSKIEAGKIEFEQIDFSLEVQLKQLSKTFESQLSDKNIGFKVVLDKEVPDILLGDPFRLNQVLINLIGNAIKFTQTGEVRVEVNVKKKYKNQVFLSLAIIDTGIGIPQLKLDHIFESFTQAYQDTSRTYGGTGLGLAITRRLVELQDGSMSVESKEDVGSRFTVTIPYKLSSATHLLSPVEEVHKEQNLSGTKVLVVEDNMMNQMVIKQVLSSWKCDFSVCDNGEIGFRKFEKEDFDIVLMDLQMPVMDGFTAAAKIRKEIESPRNSVPIIALTADAFPQTKHKVLNTGMDDFIAKPYNSNELYKKIRHLID